MDWTMSDIIASQQQSSNVCSKGRRCSNEESKHQKQASVMRANNTKQQLAHLELNKSKQANKEQPKLLSSKSLSMLVPRNLFFKRAAEAKRDTEGASEKAASGEEQLQSTRSFPGNLFRPIVAGATIEQNCKRMVNSTHLNIKPTHNTEPSSSLMSNVAASTSTNSILTVNSSTISSVALPHLSPIVCSASPGERVVDMSWSETASSTTANSTGSSERRQTTTNNRIKPLARQQRPETGTENSSTVRPTENNKRSVSVGFRHFKSTGLVLRDVKNSLGLRIKAKQESKAFAKLVNETSTTETPTKLYSPFDIYTDTSAIKAAPQTPVAGGGGGSQQRQKALGQQQSAGSRRRLNMRNSTTKQPFGVCQGAENEGQPVLDSNTPKARIVQQHKRHLMQVANNKFTFDSPAGRHCETVKDLERFQQCIEDISKAIQTRGRSRTCSSQ